MKLAFILGPASTVANIKSLSMKSSFLRMEEKRFETLSQKTAVLYTG
jgi:hypothetical protein